MESTKRLLNASFRRPEYLLFLLIVIFGGWFLAPDAAEFPMDDTYIHFVYAENLANTGQLMFNDESEIGIGTTSLLWILLLAGGVKLGIPINFAAKILGVLSLYFFGITLFYFLRPKFGERLSLISTLLVVLSGHLIWFALSGMETVLFLMFGMLALLLYSKRQWGWLGFSLGLMILSRPDGTILALTIGLVEIWRSRGLHRKLVLTMLITAVICGPWFLYLLSRTGSILPTSALGKQLTHSVAIQYGLTNYAQLGFLTRIPGLTYVLMWFAYLLEFVLGGASLAEPNYIVRTTLANIEYKVSLWAVAGWLTALFPIARIGFKKTIKPGAWNMTAQDEPHPLKILFLWLLLHNLVYILFLPTPGTASRYGALNHVFLWISCVFIISKYIPSNHYRIYLWSWLVIVALSNTVFWNGVYDANIEHMNNVRIKAAEYFRDEIPKSEVCAVSDIGAIRYFSGRKVFDMGGLINPDLRQIYLDGEFAQHISENNVSCLIVPGRADSSEDGYLDFSVVLGFAETQYFQMEEIQVMQIDRDVWLKGYLPTMNYQATVTVYKLIYPE